MLTTILFDLDDTLFDFKLDEAESLSKSLKHFGIEPSEHTIKRYSQINDSMWKLLELGKITREEVLVKRFDLLFEELRIEASGKLVKEVYEENLKNSYHYVLGAKEVLDKLCRKYDLYLVSNGTAAVQKGRIESSGIEVYFKEIFISQLVGYNKPKKEFFDTCFAKIPNFEKNKTIIVGDSLSSDIRGGNNAGIMTCWYNPKGEKAEGDLHIDYTVSNLDELPSLFEKI